MSCEDMCPARERAERMRLGEYSRVYEANGLMVKAWRRSAAGRAGEEAGDVRTLSALERTNKHLLDIVARAAFGRDSFHDLYVFLADRLHSVRQDIVFLRGWRSLREEEILVVARLLEMQARFHIVAFFLLQRVSDREFGFDRKLAFEQLQQCLTSVREFHEEVGIVSPEFIAYELLSAIGFDKPVLESANRAAEYLLSSTTEKKTEASEELALALGLARAHTTEMFLHFFRLLGKTTLLQKCLLARLVPFAQFRALQILSKAANKVDKVPVSRLRSQLQFQSNEDVIAFAQHIDMKVSDDASSSASSSGDEKKNYFIHLQFGTNDKARKGLEKSTESPPWETVLPLGLLWGGDSLGMTADSFVDTILQL